MYLYLQFRLWDIRSGQELKIINLNFPCKGINQVFPYCNDMCLIIDTNTELVCLNIITKEVICRYEAKSVRPQTYAMSKDNKRFVAKGTVYNCEGQVLVSKIVLNWGSGDRLLYRLLG